MSKVKIWQAIVVVLLLVNTVVLVFMWLHHKGGERPMPGGNIKEYLIKKLVLNDKQQKQYEDLRKEHFTSMKKINSETRDLRDRFFDNISTPVADSSLINSLSKKLSDEEIQRQQLTLFHFREFRSILNKDQQQEFDRIIRDVLRMMSRPAGPPNGGGHPQGIPPNDRDPNHKPGDENPPFDGHPPADGPPPPNP